MSTRSSLDLSEFFNDDDSGEPFCRLYEKKNRSKIRFSKTKCAFTDCETDRLSFNVQLEKLPPQPDEVEIMHSPQVQETNRTSTAEQPKSAKQQAGGRRTLLQEFESTMGGTTNFDPPICSTPISHLAKNNPELCMNANNLDEIENIEANNEIAPITIFPTPNVEIPETQQTQARSKDTSLLISSSNKQQIVVIPVNHTITKVTSQDKDKNIKSSRNQQINSCSSTVQSQSFQQAEDDLNLDDILTDDEENTPKSTLQDSQHTSEIPLNLAPSSYNLRKKQKRILKKKLYEANSPCPIPEPEVEIPPSAHNKKQINKKGAKPLNRPPGIPLNGEKYAQELARMSNYEILDLRKRNSMDQIFVISRRKSRRSLEEISKKKHVLNEQIEQEILKRNLDNVIQRSVCQSDQENGEGERLPVPYNFQDSVPAREENRSILTSLNLLEENSTDRVKFKKPIANKSDVAAEGGSLRRSKRGHVPLCRAPILDIFYQQELKRLELYEKRREQQIKKRREEAKQIKKLNKKNKTLKSTNSKSSKRTENVSENDDAPNDCSCEFQVALTNFTELQGVEYAFMIPRKEQVWVIYVSNHIKANQEKAKRFELHFINLMGLFQVRVNSVECVLGVGDMIAIKKLAHYDIKNISDDIGILMVVKK
ncbi:hypothetical protein EVAR_72045_1 [Eumeta japonica]|uniref:Uncharacterized protein n=1 Tax=Eumeta variegata TaxID=151549 RepID=A0A4C1T7F6_EUMVA|nr:hypothetical protein EVAR_72045_1 [Eumeta japonica]